MIWDLDGRIVEANDAFIDMMQYRREDLISGGVRWTDLTPPEWREQDERATADLTQAAQGQTQGDLANLMAHYGTMLALGGSNSGSPLSVSPSTGGLK